LYKITHSFSGRFVNGISYFKGEDEVLFRPGTRFYVYKSEGNTVWMHEMHDDEEVNITVRDAIAERDFDEEDDEEEVLVDSDNEEDVDNDEVDNEEEVDEDDEVVYNDNEEEDHHITTVDDVDDDDDEVVDDDDEDGHHEVDSDSDGDNHEHKQNDVNDDESFADTCAVLTVGCEDEYPTFVATDPPSVDFDSGLVWIDGRRRSARLLAKKGGSTPKPLLGSTLDHLGRRRSLRLQQKK
jgi:hypothetical protein